MTELAVLESTKGPAEKTSPVDTIARSAKTKLALNPKHPERICWGCDKYCAANDLRCGNGTIRTQHPVELFGEDWIEWELGEAASELTESDSQK